MGVVRPETGMQQATVNELEKQINKLKGENNAKSTQNDKFSKQIENPNNRIKVLKQECTSLETMTNANIIFMADVKKKQKQMNGLIKLTGVTTP
jgi:chromosome segregation ATPase